MPQPFTAFSSSLFMALLMIWAASGGALAQAWTSYVNPRFGYSLYYPADMFEPGEALENDIGATFVSEDGAVLRAEGAFDERRFGAKHYLGLALEEEANKNIVSQNLTDFEYSFTADRSDKIHYQKVKFSCREQIISKLGLTFPKSKRERYEAIIPKLEQRFFAGQGYDTPDNCV